MNTIENPTTEVVAPEVSKPTKAKIQVGRFEGAFKLFALTYFNMLKFYAFEPKIAHKVANDAVASLGLAMSKDATLAAKISKANKNGEHSFKLSGKSAAVSGSNAMLLVRLCQQLDAIREEELLSKELKLSALMDYVHNGVSEYVAECEAWAAKQEWEEKKS